METEMEERFISLEEVSKRLGVGRFTLEQYVKEGMPYVAITEKRKRFLYSQVLKWFIKHRGHGKWQAETNQ